MNKEYGAIKIEFKDFTKEKFINLISCIRNNDLITNVINSDNNILKILLSGIKIKNKLTNVISEYKDYLSEYESISEIDDFTHVFRKELIELFGLDITYNLELTTDNNSIIRHIYFSNEGQNKVKVLSKDKKKKD